MTDISKILMFRKVFDMVFPKSQKSQCFVSFRGLWASKSLQNIEFFEIFEMDFQKTFKNIKIFEIFEFFEGFCRGSPLKS